MMSNCRRRCRRYFATVLHLVGAGLLAAIAPAGSVELRVWPDEAYVGEPIVAEVTISDFRAADEPTFPEIPNCTIVSQGVTSSGQEFTIANGRRVVRATKTYRFLITPGAAGEIEIPSLSLTVDGRAQVTEPLRILVRTMDASQFIRAEVRPGFAPIYVGQQVPLALLIYIRPAPLGESQVSASDMWSFVEETGFGPFGYRRFEALDGRRTQRIANSSGEPERWYVYELTSNWVAPRAGPLDFEDIQISIRYPIEFERSLFGTAVRRSRTIRASATAVAGEVVELPAEGRPALFTGAVGEYRVSTRATPTSVRVGDPVELSIELRGTGPIASLPPPKLAEYEPLTRDFRVPVEDLPGAVDGNVKRFTQVIRPLRAGVRAIPPIEYPYFEPHSGRYVVAESEPIVIEVGAADLLRASDLAGAAPPNANPDAEVTALDGLRANLDNDAELLHVSTNVTPGKVVLVAAAPPAAYLASWLGVSLIRARGADARGARRRNAGARARGRLALARSTDAPAAEIGSALAEFLADRLGAPPAHFVGAQHRRELQAKKLPPALLQRTSDLLQRTEAAAYGGARSDIEPLAAEAEECIRELERYL